MAALLDVDLEQVAHVIEARRRRAEEALLLDRRRLGVSLHHNEPAKERAVFAGDFLPCGLALVTAKRNRASLDFGGKQDAPAIARHLHIAELGPAGGVHADGGAEIDLRLLIAHRAHVAPPVEILWSPGLERALKLLVRGESDVVGNHIV